jgi:hypothetical protein
MQFQLCQINLLLLRVGPKDLYNNIYLYVNLKDNLHKTLQIPIKHEIPSTLGVVSY